MMSGHQALSSPGHTRVAIFAGGCFWCMQPPYDGMDGVIATTVGYTGGQTPNPSYEDVSSGRTGHVEAVRIEYDPDRVSYRDLLDLFWRSIDPTDPGGQFADQGSQYHTFIFYTDEPQRQEAEDSKTALQRSGRFKKPVVTQIRPVSAFYPAGEEHQKYYKSHALHYKTYRAGSGREGFLEKTWPQRNP